MRWGRFATENHRGVLVPRILGLWLGAAGALSTLIIALASGVSAAGWGALVGTLLVLGAGLIDDLFPIGPRGLRNHLRSLARGHMTTGVLKVVVIGACAIVVIALQPVRPGWVRLSGVVLVAASANVANGLDVAPGRALKAFLPVLAVVLVADLPLALLPTAPGVATGAALALAPDLRERAMLGDGGSNLLGFTAGLGLYLVMPGWGIGLAAAFAVVLNVLADTVSLSRLIAAAAPLRWLDRLGRVEG
jgi:hypothetical protein